jgi:hypothetical protein
MRMPQVLTANRLVVGEVVYWGGPAGWVQRLEQAEVLMNGAGEVVAPYLFDVRVNNGVPAPVKVREVIRAAGPTVRRDLGKQAD